MPNITGTGTPPATLVTCPRCKAPRLFIATGPDPVFVCSGCEWPFTFSAGTSPLTTNAAVTAGVSTALPFASGGTQFSSRQPLWIADGGNSEVVFVNGTPTGTSVPIVDLDYNHSGGVTVTIAAVAPTLSTIEKIPNAGGWGF